MKRLRTVWRWVAGQVSREVPVEDALCEFDCRKPQCFEGEWKSCMRRLQRAAGELMPLKVPSRNP
jgi:hypothetical protein